MIKVKIFAEQDAYKVGELFNEWLGEVQRGEITQIKRSKFKVLDMVFGEAARCLAVLYEGWQDQ